MIKKIKAYFRLKRIEKLTKELDELNDIEKSTNEMINRLEDHTLRYYAPQTLSIEIGDV